MGDNIPARCFWHCISIIVALSLGGTLHGTPALTLTAYAAKSPMVQLTTQGEMRVGVPFQVVLTLTNVPHLGGYETVLAFDPTQLHTQGLEQTNNDLTGAGREVHTLGPFRVRDGLIFGAATTIGAIASTGDVGGTVRLATLKVVPMVAGPVTLQLSNTKVVDVTGTPLAVTPANTALTLNVAAGTFESSLSNDTRVTVSLSPTTRARSTTRTNGDLTGDGRLEESDVQEAVLNWRLARERGELCGFSAPASADLVADGCFDIGDVQTTAARVAAALQQQPPQSELSAAQSSVWIVNSAADAADIVPDEVCKTVNGDCTLRAAIQEANVSLGGDQIQFNIPGVGVHTIQLTDELPTLSGGHITIDGYTQPGTGRNTSAITSNARILIEIKGRGVVKLDGKPGFIGMRIISPNNVVRGLAFYNLYRGIHISGSNAHNNTIAGNFIGTDAAGTFGYNGTIGEPFGYGLNINSGATNTAIGGTARADRNVVSGNGNDGISISNPGTTGTRIIGNIIGLNPGGAARVPNGADGIDLNYGVQNTQIGGLHPEERNVISGNIGDGVEISHNDPEVTTANNRVQGNFIGADLQGNAATLNETKNGGWGVTLEDSVSNNTVGPDNVIVGNTAGGVQIDGLNGVAAKDNRILGNRIGVDIVGAVAGNQGSGIELRFTTQGTLMSENIIANNVLHGISIPHDGSDFNTVSLNRFYANKGLAIDLGEDGVTPNDPGDGDGGPNQRLNFPEFRSVTPQAVTGRTCGSCRVEVYQTEVCGDTHGEGAVYLGTTVAPSSGIFSLSITASPGKFITATATDPQGNTSEFALNTAVSNAGSKNASCRVYLPLIHK